MRRWADDQGTLFGLPTPSQPAHPRKPPRQTTVTISAEAIAAATVGRIDGERMIVEAVRAARPEVRNVAMDLSTIRWTDPETSLRVSFVTGASLARLVSVDRSPRALFPA
jgi:hypothetical protein